MANKNLTPIQEDKLERLHELMCQLQEEIEELAAETGNEDINNAALSANDAVLSLGIVQANQIRNARDDEGEELPF